MKRGQSAMFNYGPVPVLLAALVALTATACDSPSDPGCSNTLVTTVSISATGQLRMLTAAGDTLRLRATALSECGDTVRNTPFAWSSSNPTVATVVDGLVSAQANGTAAIRATASSLTDSIITTVAIPTLGNFTILGLGAITGFATTELWVHGDYAYTGTTSGRLYTWRISETAAPVLVDSLIVAGSVGDVMTSPDGKLGFLAMQGSAVGRGVAILNLDNPARPVFHSLYSTNLELGVHTLWFERINNRNYVFAVENGSSTNGGLHVLDVTNIAAPVEVEHFYGGTSFGHDVYVRDGLAFLCHWDAGLIILDVGNGIRGGSPESPVEVSRLVTGLRSVHNVWYWPARKLAFVGEERAGGRLQVIDLADLTQPRLIGFYEIPDGVPHNFWMDEPAGLLYAGWYIHGVRVFDVTGTLQGNIASREIGFTTPSGPNGRASIWGPQLHRGIVFAADLNNGLWALRFQR